MEHTTYGQGASGRRTTGCSGRRRQIGAPPLIRVFYGPQGAGITVSDGSNSTTRVRGAFLMRGLVCALLLFTGAVFLYDSSAYSLSPSHPSSGRTKGCYTFVDLAVGATMPTLWARPLEFLL